MPQPQIDTPPENRPGTSAPPRVALLRQDTRAELERVWRAWRSIERRWPYVEWRSPHGVDTHQLRLMPITAAAEIIWLARRGLGLVNPVEDALPKALLDILLADDDANEPHATVTSALVVDIAFANAGVAPFEAWILLADKNESPHEPDELKRWAVTKLKELAEPAPGRPHERDPRAIDTPSICTTLMDATGVLVGRTSLQDVVTYTLERLREYEAALVGGK